MTKPDKSALLGTFLVIALGAGFAFAGSGGELFSIGTPHPFTIAVVIAFCIQWLAFIPAYLTQSERYFDLVGSMTYISCSLVAFLFSSTKDPRSLLLLALVLIWAARLGAFLFRRIHKSGKDGRFDELKTSFFRFLGAWTLQALWVTFTSAAAWAAISSTHSRPIGVLAIAGIIIWILGFSIESIADQQKKSFTSNPANKGRFINTGLWARSRHPNYFGEIMLWFGIAIIAFPALHGWQYLALTSPLFVALLLCKVSGIPLLEERADKKWGGDDDYKTYKKETPVLIPRW